MFHSDAVHGSFGDGMRPKMLAAPFLGLRAYRVSLDLGLVRVWGRI